MKSLQRRDGHMKYAESPLKNGKGAPPTLKASGGTRGEMRIAYQSDVPSRKLGQFENESCNIRSFNSGLIWSRRAGMESSIYCLQKLRMNKRNSNDFTHGRGQKKGHYQGHRADNNKTQIDAVGGTTFITICAWADCINSFPNVCERVTPRFLQKKKNMTCKNDH